MYPTPYPTGSEPASPWAGPLSDNDFGSDLEPSPAIVATARPATDPAGDEPEVADAPEVGPTMTVTETVAGESLTEMEELTGFDGIVRVLHAETTIDALAPVSEPPVAEIEIPAAVAQYVEPTSAPHDEPAVETASDETATDEPIEEEVNDEVTIVAVVDAETDREPDTTEIDDAVTIVEASVARPPARTPALAAAQQLCPGDIAESPLAVWTDGDAETYRELLHHAQANFVDDPVAAVSEAAAVVSSAIDALTTTLQRQHADLDPHRHTDNPDTESLRIALRAHREFLGRILAL